MYNIVIADDEQLERMVLRQALEDYLGERCVVRVAANGREAVEAALLAEADVAILDIEMPGMNGLEAAQKILQKLPHCKVIMLTAYSEFEYAQKAISFGSADYLLKPCADEDLHRTLDRILSQIDRRREGDAEKERSQERIHTLSLQIEEQIVRTVMGGHISPAYILLQMKNYGVEFCNGVFAILYGANRLNNNKNILSSLKTSSWPEHIHPFLYSYDGKVYIVTVSDHRDVDAFDATCTQLTLLSQAAKTLWGYPLHAAIGKCFTEIQNAQLSCFQAQVALGKCTDAHPINAYEEDRDAEPAEFADNPMVGSVLFGDVEEIGRVASSYVNNLSAQQLEGDIIVSRLNDYLAQTAHSLRQQTGLPVSDAALSIPADAGDLESLKHHVASRLCYLADQLLAQGEVGHLQKVKGEIERYVAKHYSEDLFLPGIARAMNYSSAYFSRLFKQCFQRNFISYLTDVRIQEAKRLIRTTDLTIREIGEKVGYKDPNYFTKVFRKVIGCNPSDYRDGDPQ